MHQLRLVDGGHGIQRYHSRNTGSRCRKPAPQFVPQIEMFCQRHRLEAQLHAFQSIIEEAVAEKLARLEKSRLAQECAKLDPAFEKALAEEGLSEDLAEWPEY